MRSVSGRKHGHDQICPVPDRGDGHHMGGHQAAEKQSDFHWRAPLSAFPDASSPVGLSTVERGLLSCFAVGNGGGAS